MTSIYKGPGLKVPVPDPDIPGPAHYVVPPPGLNTSGGVVSSTTRDARALVYLGPGTGLLRSETPGPGAYRYVTPRNQRAWRAL